MYTSVQFSYSVSSLTERTVASWCNWTLVKKLPASFYVTWHAVDYIPEKHRMLASLFHIQWTDVRTNRKREYSWREVMGGSNTWRILCSTWRPFYVTEKEGEEWNACFYLFPYTWSLYEWFLFEHLHWPFPFVSIRIMLQSTRLHSPASRVSRLPSYNKPRNVSSNCLFF